ncbi:M3 family oligoendopeptidase [Fictibacillus iocasae]|uniref:M3 family oligoendopeptidase n=1 Tax=Fictibacillus iocasae TaxID=2715437 RepID=A0ABW2NMJ4_9BACL
MKFSQFAYKRPNLNEVKVSFNKHLVQFKEAKTFEEQEVAMSSISMIRSEFESMAKIARTRYTINTADEFYKKEQAFMDENLPVYQGLIKTFYEALTTSAFQREIEETHGKQLLKLAELRVKTYSDEVLEDLKLENKLTSEYVNLVASAKIEFDGRELTLAQFAPYMQSEKRETRHQAYLAGGAFFSSHEERFDEIYDKLVKLRTNIAHKLGYKSYVQLGYDRMSRTDYNAADVKVFRDQVRDVIVPLCTELKNKQHERIGTPEFYYYDETFEFPDGNPKPQGDVDWIVERAQSVFQELSDETGRFFAFMTENELMDLHSKKGKAAGGYCTYFSTYQSPFIFTNFNGSDNDIRVLLHEIGHAYQMHASRGYEVPEYQFPTLEACEIHSMSMEFLTYPSMKDFFEGDTEKYLYSHLTGAVEFIPYGVAVDEFQHFVYENPDATPQERRQEWSRLEKIYLPHRNYAGLEYLENGGFWHRQGHIYKSPFYYIDYTLAQICALQFWKRSREDQAAAWRDYDRLCKLGGSLAFTELVKEAGLTSPFHAGCVEDVVQEVRSFLGMHALR